MGFGNVRMVRKLRFHFQKSYAVKLICDKNRSKYSQSQTEILLLLR
jgi:hypothetical protein